METKNYKILVVDDETDLKSALEIALVHEGFVVITASDGEEGLKKAITERPDLILLDIMMPKMSGIDVLKKLQEDEWGKSARVIVMTALADMNKIAEVIEAGGEEYLVKTTVSLGEIVQKVKGKFNI